MVSIITKVFRKFKLLQLLIHFGYPPYKLLFDQFKHSKRIEELAFIKDKYREIAYKKYGLKFSEQCDVGEVFFENIYTQYTDFIPSNKDLVIDVGAQYGDYAILCSKFYGARVTAFEPLLKNYELFKRNIKLNFINDANIKLYNFALGSANKIIYLSYSGDMVHKWKSKDVQKVVLKRLDVFKLKPTILKIDVEGFEMEVLAGAIKTLRRYHPKIIIEVHSRDLKNRVLKMLSAFGYKVRHEGRVIINKESEMDFVQNLFLY